MDLACRYLEEVGIRVEGGVFLVRFGWYGGYARMQERGYHVEAVSDIWSDFIYHMDDEPRPISNPSKVFPKFQWSSARAGKAAPGSVGAVGAARIFDVGNASPASARAGCRIPRGRRRVDQPALQGQRLYSLRARWVLADFVAKVC